MVILGSDVVRDLIDVESGVHYGCAPPPERDFYVSLCRSSPILVSAPHGARTYRNVDGEVWHEEDEYTAGMALLLSELCSTSVIASVWRSDREDPNRHPEEASEYKRRLKELVSDSGVRWVIDLHGARRTTAHMDMEQLVDIGKRKHLWSLPKDQVTRLTALAEGYLGKGCVSHDGFPALACRRTITAYAHGDLQLNAVQIEMKPEVRVPRRRVDSSAYVKEGPFSADPKRVLGMLQVLVDFIEGLPQELLPPGTQNGVDS